MTVTMGATQLDDIRSNALVSVLVVDPTNTSRFIEVRGVAELIDAGPQCTIHARRITLDAIH